MAHSALHFSIGMAAATLATVPGLIRRRRRPDRLAPFFARWIGFSLALGVFAIAPALLRRAGLPDAVCDGWWMNVFFLHSRLQRAWPGRGMLPGLMLIATISAAQYALIVAAILRKRTKRKLPPAACSRA